MLRARLLAMSLLALSSSAFASGQLDPKFDGDGRLIVNAAAGPTGFDDLQAGLIDARGRYVGAGYGQDTPTQGGTVLRVLPGGARDASFGSNGVARLPRPQFFASVRLRAVAEQADGKLVVAGRYAEFSFDEALGFAYVCRLLESGQLDAEFGNDGCTSPSFHPDSSRDVIFGMALQDDGRIVLAGGTDVGNDGGLWEYVVARLDDDGSLDRCFGDPSCQTGGVLIQPEPDAELDNFEARAVAVAQDQKIVLAGRASSLGQLDMAVVRLQPTGSVDAGFGNGGHRRVAFDQGGGGNDRAFGLVVRNDNSILITGEVSTDFGDLVGLAALDASGTPIDGFGTQGKIVTFFNDVSLQQVGTQLALQADGKIVLSGYTNDADPEENFDYCGVLRLHPDGQPDLDFGFSGSITLNVTDGADAPRPTICRGMGLDSRSIVLFGQVRPESGAGNDSLLFRLDQDNLFRDGFESDD